MSLMAAVVACLVLFVNACYCTTVLGRSSPTIGSSVTLDYGTFTGLINETTGIIYFRGIRYADAPVGDLRWRAPVSPPSKHLGNVDATEFANACIQTTQTSVTTGTSEDCLFGNVNIPIDTRVGDKNPVMVWFHGGGFQSGNTHTSPPDFLMQSSASPMIFVSFEYRLGQFGFLGGSLIKADGDLNAGLLDQRTALRWVQRYIHQFGGDSSRVTIWGESAGAGATMFHLLGNGGNNEGLFRAAMGDSPSLSYMPAFNEPYDENIFDQLSSFAGCGSRSNMTLSCLRSASSSVLTLAGSQMISTRPATIFVFAPILDGTFMKERPVEAFFNGHFSKVPVLFGSNTNEGANWSAGLSDASANTSMANATEETVFNFLRGQYLNLTESSFRQGMKELYNLDDFNGSFSLQGQQMYGEARYICSALLVTGSLAIHDIPAYQFHYDNPDLGSDHGSDLQAFFQPPPVGSTADDLVLFDTMRELWTSFVIDGKPSARSSNINWPLATTANGSPRLLLHPGDISVEIISEILSTRCSFWHGISNEIHT